MHIKYSINLLPGRRIGHKTKAKAGQTKPCQWTHDPVTFPPLPVSRFPLPLSQSPFPQSRSHKQLNTAAACNMCLSTYTHIYIYISGCFGIVGVAHYGYSRIQGPKHLSIWTGWSYLFYLTLQVQNVSARDANLLGLNWPEGLRMHLCLCIGGINI